MPNQVHVLGRDVDPVPVSVDRGYLGWWIRLCNRIRLWAERRVIFSLIRLEMDAPGTLPPVGLKPLAVVTPPRPVRGLLSKAIDAIEAGSHVPRPITEDGDLARTLGRAEVRRNRSFRYKPGRDDYDEQVADFERVGEPMQHDDQALESPQEEAFAPPVPGPQLTDPNASRRAQVAAVGGVDFEVARQGMPFHVNLERQVTRRGS